MMPDFKIRNLFLRSLALAALLPVSARADVFTFAERSIKVPAPEGYVRLTDDMPLAKKAAGKIAASDRANETLAVYIPQESVAAARAGTASGMEGRYLFLKINRALRNKTASRGDFAQLKSGVKKTNLATNEQLRKEIGKASNAINQSFSQEGGQAVKLSIGQIFQLPPHEEADDLFAVSMLVNYGVLVNGRQEDYPMAITSTFVNVSGTVLFLYAGGQEKELEWTRAASRAWAAAVLAANPPPPRKRSFSSGWGSVSNSAVRGGIIGLVVVLAMLLASKLRKTPPAQ